MLQLDNRTPYGAERAIVMDKFGEKRWIVAVRATFHLKPDGSTALAEEQSEPLFSAEHWGEPATSSIRYEADLIPTKAATDVVVNGQAHAPGGRPASTVDIRLRVGPIDKRLRVFGDRRWECRIGRAPGVGLPARFAQMPIVWERAFGGWDRSDTDPAKHRLYAANPVGSGFALSAEAVEGQALPNVEDPGHLITGWDDRPLPAGLGAVASFWSPRLERGGTYDEAWEASKLPLLPDDFDDRFYQHAPLDQQVGGWLRGGEDVFLENLTVSGRLNFTLPRVPLGFSTRFGRDREEHRAFLQTVVIEPDEERLILVWQTSLDCHHRLDELDRTIVYEKRRV